jgi:hypothetical protein
LTSAIATNDVLAATFAITAAGRTPFQLAAT